MDTLAAMADEFVEAAKARPAGTVILDVTEFSRNPESGKKQIIEWRSPSVKLAYMIHGDAMELQKRNPDWPDGLAFDVATMGVCHVAPTPGGLAITQFYERIANQNDKMFFALVTRLQQEFPHLKGTRDSAVLVDLCVQYLMRHPEELDHLPSRVLGDLQKLADAKRATSNLFVKE